jgi:polyhydroxybutyrate depolymerase
MKNALRLIAFGSFFLSLAMHCTAQTMTTFATTWNNQPRNYAVYLPRNLKANPSMVLFLHGTWPGSGMPWQMVPQWESEANAGKFVLVLPISTYLPKVNVSYWAAFDVNFSFASDPDDAGFLCNLIPALVAQYAVNPNAVYVTGMSSGALMTQRVAMTCPDEIAAIAPVAGQLYIKQMTDPWQPPARISSPVSVLEIHGDADADLPYCGQAPHQQWTISFLVLPSVDDDVAYWARVNGLPAPTLSLCTGGAPTSSVTTETLTNGATTVQFIDDVGEGHLWPRWAFQAVTEFFAAHPKQ